MTATSPAPGETSRERESIKFHVRRLHRRWLACSSPSRAGCCYFACLDVSSCCEVKCSSLSDWLKLAPAGANFGEIFFRVPGAFLQKSSQKGKKVRQVKKVEKAAFWLLLLLLLRSSIRRLWFQLRVLYGGGRLVMLFQRSIRQQAGLLASASRVCPAHFPLGCIALKLEHLLTNADI